MAEFLSTQCRTSLRLYKYVTNENTLYNPIYVIRSIFIHPLSSWINGILFFQRVFRISLSLSLSQLERIDADLVIPIIEIKRDIWP